MSINLNEFVKNQEGVKKSLKNKYRITIEVQYCTNCQAHQIQGKHSSQKYKNQYEQLRKKLQQNGILVKAKQIPNNLYKKSPYSPANIYYNIDTDQEVSFPQVGAFEVYFNNKKIYSKIQTKRFPNVDSLLQQIYKLSIKNNNYFRDRAFVTKKKKSHKDTIIQSIMTKEQKYLSLDFQKLEESKQKYYRFKQNFQQKRRKLSNYGQEIRPNTTNLARIIQKGKQIKSNREYYSRGHEKTNEQVLNISNKELEASLNIRQVNKILQFKQDSKSKSPNFIRSSPKKDNDKYSQYSVYLQSLKPKKKSKDTDFESHKVRLRKKILEYQFRYDKQIKNINEIKFQKPQGLNNLQNEQKLIYAELLQNMHS